MASDTFEFRSQSLSTFHPSSLSSATGGVGSFNSTSLARMESKFCKNFVCCSIPLDDLHDLLEHYEQAHCSALPPHPRHDIVFEDEGEWSSDPPLLPHDDPLIPNLHPHLPDHPLCDQDLARVRNRLCRASPDPFDRPSSIFVSELMASFHDSLGIPPALLDGHPQSSSALQTSIPNNPSSAHSPSASNINYHHLHHLHSSPPNSLQGLRRADDPLSRIKDPLLRKRFADRDWDPAHLAASSLGSMEEEKPFKCSVPGCEKAYKQQNGLKYHKAHGHCSPQRNLTTDDDACGKRYPNLNGLRCRY